MHSTTHAVATHAKVKSIMQVKGGSRVVVVAGLQKPSNMPSWAAALMRSLGGPPLGFLKPTKLAEES